MNIIVLGASSNIGSRIAAAFAPGNNLLLVGRDAERLKAAADRCLSNGAGRIVPLHSDLRDGCGEILRAASDWPVDVIINSASATSRLRDNEISADKLADYVKVDLLAPLELIERVRATQASRPLSIIFISTILTLVKSPNRAIYSNLKILQEQCLQTLQRSQRSLYVLIVRIAKVIPPEGPTPATDRLTRAVKAAFEKKKPTLLYGFSGRLLTALFYTQPLLFRLAVHTRRLLTPRGEPGAR